MKLKSLKYYLQTLLTEDIITYLINKHRDFYDYEKDVNEKLKNFSAGYAATINELLSFEPSDKHQIIELVLIENDPFNDNESWINVLIKNDKFIKNPPENLKIWGGNSNDEGDCPEGHYNINWNGYQKHFGISGIERAKMLDSPIEIERNAFEFLNRRIEAVIGEIIFECTFNGFLEKDCEKFWEEIKSRIDDDSDKINWENLKKELGD